MAEKADFGFFGTFDPRLFQENPNNAPRAMKIVENAVAAVSGVHYPDGTPVKVVGAPKLVSSVSDADEVAAFFKERQVTSLANFPDTWAFPGETLSALLAHFPKDTPISSNTGNSGPKPGVVFAHASNGALAQAGMMSHLNVGSWPDTGMDPKMDQGMVKALTDWMYASLAYQSMKGRRILIIGHSSMHMETADAHKSAMRDQLGLEIVHLDMKAISDRLTKKAYDEAELKRLRDWLDERVGQRIELQNQADEDRLMVSLAMYLIIRDLCKEYNAIGAGFMSQLEWGSDADGIPLPVADIMESLFNSTFDHNGPKPPFPFATEADVQGLLTMIILTFLSGGAPPLFMDFRKVWEPHELRAKAAEIGIELPSEDELEQMQTADPERYETLVWLVKGLVDGDNSGSASFDWAGKPGEDEVTVMSRVTMPLADSFYFPGLGNSVNFVSPAGLDGIAARMAFSSLSGMFSMVWDEATTVELPEELAQAVCNTSTPTWPHTFVVPKYATMYEYKHLPPANHFHMTWSAGNGLCPARLQMWMDMANVLSATPWAARPQFIEGVDRPLPLLYVLNGGEVAAKMLRAGPR